MLLDSSYGSKSLVDFLSSVLQTDNLKVKLGFLNLEIFYRDNTERKRFLDLLPSDIIKEDPANHKLIIKKVDLVFFRKKIQNPFRYATCGGEYNIRLMMYLLVEVTDLWKLHCENIYYNITGPYKHDVRENFYKLVNYFFRNNEFSGRMESTCITDVIPLCFPNPELLRKKICIYENGMYGFFLCDTKKFEDSVLFQVIKKKLSLLQSQIDSLCDGNELLKLLNQKKSLKLFIDYVLQIEKSSILVLKVPFHVLHATLSILSNDEIILKEIENLLKERQQYDITNSIVCKFFQDKKIKIDFLDISDARNIYKSFYSIENNSPEVILRSEKAISDLHAVKSNITMNLDFFSEISQNRGILRAQQYFRGITALINSEINFLENFKDVLTMEDLNFLLEVTFQEVHHDINELLVMYDFFMHRKIVYRNPILKVTRKEISELKKYVSSRVLLLDEIVRYMNDNLKVIGSNKYFMNYWVIYYIVSSHHTLSFEFIKNGQLLPSINVVQLLKSIDYVDGRWVTCKKEKNEWFLHQLRLHYLMDYLDINIDSSDIPEELWDDKLSNRDFFIILQSIIRAVRVDKQYVCDIKISSFLRVLQILYRVLKYLPFSSFFIYYVNPGRYRTVSGYIGRNLKEELYIKNKQIPVTSFSNSVIESLKLNLSQQRFVESDHEAKFLSRKFCKAHNISGKLEKVKTVLYSNKFVAYLLFILTFLIMLIITVCVILLGHFNIISGIFLARFIDIIRRACDSLFVISGLDTFVDKVRILMLDVIGIVVRVLDFILLCGLLSEVIKLVITGIRFVCISVYNVLQEVCRSLVTYGLKGSIIILLNKVLYLKNVTVKGYDHSNEKEELDVYGMRRYHTEYNIAEMLEDICNKINIDLPVLLRITEITKELSSQINQNLYYGKPRIENLLRDFENYTAKLPQDIISNVNYLKLKYEFSYLLNNYIKNFSYHNDCKSDLPNILNSFRRREEIYDRITSVNLQTKYFSKGSYRTICTVSDVESIFDRVRYIGNAITVETLNIKIASLKWAIHMLSVCDVYNIKRNSELVFLNTRLDNIVTVVLYDCILRLEKYRKRVQHGEVISTSFVDVDINCNFSCYIRDVYYLLQSVDTSIIYNGQMRSMKIFFDTFFSHHNLLLKEPSDQAKNLARTIRVETGTISCFSRFKEYICESMECIKNPKGTVFSFFIYYLIRLTNSTSCLLSITEHVSQIMDQVLNVIAIEELYKYFTQTDFGKILLLEFYKQGMLFQDLTCMLAELNLGLLCDDVCDVQDECLPIYDINYLIYSSSFHRINEPQWRLLECINGCARLIYEMVGLKMVKHITHCFRDKVIYNIESFILHENMISNSMLMSVQECLSANELKCDVEEGVSCANGRSDQLLLDPDGVYHMLGLSLDFD